LHFGKEVMHQISEFQNTSQMDSNVDDYSRYRDSQRYINVENNYQYLKCRSMANNKGGANGDQADRDHTDPMRVKNYKNYEKQIASKLKKGYRKIHQDAE